MTSTLVKDSIVGDQWIQQAMAACPIQKRLDQNGLWNGDILTGPVRLVWVDLFELPAPKKPGDIPKFGAQLLFPSGADTTVFRQEHHNMCCKEFPEYWVEQSQAFMGLASPFRDQAEKMNVAKGYTPGALFLSTSSKFKPSVVDKMCNPIVDRSKVYAGVWAICSVNVYSYGKNPPQPKKGVKFGLQSVMIIGDDTPLSGGGVDPREAFKGVNVSAPMVRPNLAAMPAGMTVQGPAPGIPGYTATGGVYTPPASLPPSIPQQHWTPPSPPMGNVPAPGAGFGPAIVSPSEDDLSFLNG